MSSLNASMKAQKSLTERLIHAVGFEVMALLICAPVAAWIMNKPVLAMVWNVVYNSVFDYFWPMGSVKRTFPLRVGHALGFEGGFILIGLPIAAWWLQISLIDAFVLELGFFLFFLPYTIGYNWLYDTLRQRVMSRKRNQAREPLRR
jgi:uncharacterized membrane protein